MYGKICLVDSFRYVSTENNSAKNLLAVARQCANNAGNELNGGGVERPNARKRKASNSIENKQSKGPRGGRGGGRGGRGGRGGYGGAGFGAGFAGANHFNAFYGGYGRGGYAGRGGHFY